MKSGVLAGYPLDKLKVTVIDGSYHPVDSDQLSFEICAMQAFRNAAEKADPVFVGAHYEGRGGNAGGEHG